MTEKNHKIITMALKVAISVVAVTVCVVGFAFILSSAVRSGSTMEWFLAVAYGVVLVLGGTLVGMEFYGGRDDG